MVLLLNLCPSYLWLLRLGFQKKKCLHSILDVDWLCLSFCLFLIFVLGFVGNPIMKRKQKKCVFWPQHYYRLVIRPQISPHRPHLTYWLGSGVPSHHALNMIFPLISPSWREATVGHRQPKTDRSKVFSFDVRTPPPAPPCSSSVTGHENLGYSLALSGPGAVTIGVGTSGGADSWNRRKLLTDWLWWFIMTLGGEPGSILTRGRGVASQPRKPFETEIKRFLESTQWFD